MIKIDELMDELKELKAIKETVEVQEPSFQIVIALIVVGLLLLGWAIYLFKNRRRRRKKPTVKEIALERLKNLDYDNTKEVVYGFQESTEPFLNEKNQDKFNEIIKELGIYKYKKEIPPLDKKIEDEIKAFIKELR